MGGGGSKIPKIEPRGFWMPPYVEYHFPSLFRDKSL